MREGNKKNQRVVAFVRLPSTALPHYRYCVSRASSFRVHTIAQMQLKRYSRDALQLLESVPG